MEMDFCKVRTEAHLRKVIVDRFNEIPSKASVGHDNKKDEERYFRDKSGLLILPRGKTASR